MMSDASLGMSVINKSQMLQEDLAARHQQQHQPQQQQQPQQQPPNYEASVRPRSYSSAAVAVESEEEEDAFPAPLGNGELDGGEIGKITTFSI